MDKMYLGTLMLQCRLIPNLRVKIHKIKVKILISNKMKTRKAFRNSIVKWNRMSVIMEKVLTTLGIFHPGKNIANYEMVLILMIKFEATLFYKSFYPFLI